MSRKIKLILIVIFILITGIVFFVIFNDTVFAPHQIVIKNSAIEADPENIVIENQPPLPEEVVIEPKKETKEIAQTEPKEKADGKLIITKKLVSWGFSTASSRKIDTIVIHSSYNALGGGEYDLEKLIAEYQEYGVAPHYLIDRKGKIYRLVEDKNIAYHAGESQVPDGRTQVNNFSLGIELMNTKEDNYTAAQYSSLNDLLSQIKSGRSIKYVLGHDDIAPGRKTDPWNFDWKKVN